MTDNDTSSSGPNGSTGPQSGRAEIPGNEQGPAQAGVDLDQLKQDVAKLRDDFSQLIQSGAEAAREQLAMQVEGVRSAMSSVRSGGGKAVGAMSNTIEERPLAAVIVAFGVGILVAKLIDR